MEGSIAFSRHFRYFEESRNMTLERMPLEMGLSFAGNVAASVQYFMTVCNISEEDALNRLMNFVKLFLQIFLLNWKVSDLFQILKLTLIN